MANIKKNFKYYLDCRYDKRRSFYGKAQVVEFEDGSSVLESYLTIVACITPEGKLYVDGKYSQTTTRHIKEYIKQMTDFKADTIGQIVKEFNDDKFDFTGFKQERCLF